MEHSASRLRARAAAVLALLLVAGTLLGAQAKPANATELGRAPAAIFLQLADHVEVPTIVGGWYARYDGIDGESLDANHDKWVDIVLIDWGADKPGASATGTSRRRAAAEVRDFVIAFDYEKASVKVLEKLLLGAVIPKLEIELTLTFGGQRVPYLKYELKNVQVVSYDVHGAADGTRPMVVVGNNFEEIKVTYTEYDAEGQPQGNTETSWKVEKGEK